MKGRVGHGPSGEAVVGGQRSLDGAFGGGKRSRKAPEYRCVARRWVIGSSLPDKLCDVCVQCVVHRVIQMVFSATLPASS